jgi:hypothetical protein
VKEGRSEGRAAAVDVGCETSDKSGEGGAWRRQMGKRADGRRTEVRRGCRRAIKRQYPTQRG